MHITIFDGTFKTTAFIRRLLQGLVEAGHQVSVLGFNEANPRPINGVNYVKLGDNHNKLKLIKTTLFWGIKSGYIFKSLQNIFRADKKAIQQHNLKAALNHLQPDIVHLQWVSNIGLFEELLEQQDYRFVLSQRGFQTNVRPFINRDNFNYLSHWLPKFSGFHSVSKAISKKSDQIYAAQNKIDQVVYTGLDFNQFQFNSEVATNTPLQIISVGRPHWKKAYDIALKAMAILKQNNIDFTYTIIGGKGDEELLFLCDDLGLTSHVELMRQLPQHKVFDYMQSAAIFLLPSLEEGIANVAVEAMALGCPVISTNCGGMAELITHSEEGWLVPTYNSQAIADELINFSTLSTQHIKTVKENALKKVKQQHNHHQMIEGMMKLYSKVLK